MSDLVNKALANLLASQHETNQAVKQVGLAVKKMDQAMKKMDHSMKKMDQSVGKLAGQGDTQMELIQELINAMENQSANSVPLRQKVAELEERLIQVERKVS